MDKRALSLSLSTENFGKFFYDGSWHQPSTSDTLRTQNPATEEYGWEFAVAHPKDVDLAVTSARRAFDSGVWRIPVLERVAYLRELGRLLLARQEHLAFVWTEQMGALYKLTKSAQRSLINAIDTYTSIAEGFSFREENVGSSGAGIVAWEPVGVVAAIAPWNGPFATMIHKIAPALLAGCPVIMKPSPETPAEAVIIAECAEQAGFPPGVVNLLIAGTPGSDYLVRHPGVDKVSFTGSVETGRHIASVCGSRIARCSLELGGKSAAIVCDDYDLDLAAEKLSKAIVSMAGQNCAALSRVIVSERNHDALRDKIAERLSRVTIGDPYDTDVEMGPLAMKRHLAKVMADIERGRAEGAQLACGGRRPAGLNIGCYVEPTLFANVDSRMSIAQNEIFGPVQCLLPSRDDEHAVALANDSRFGLAGAVFTNDRKRAERLAEGIRTGTVTQNRAGADFLIGFGGFKQSGIGREGGVQGLRLFLESKAMLLEQDQAASS
jgi:betaine-aldehyde dehydrogenase